MTDIKNQIKEVVWSLVQKYYNVDRRDPAVLIRKSLNQNSIDRIGEDLGELVQEILIRSTQPAISKNDDEEDSGKYDWEYLGRT